MAYLGCLSRQRASCLQKTRASTQPCADFKRRRTEFRVERPAGSEQEARGLASCLRSQPKFLFKKKASHFDNQNVS